MGRSNSVLRQCQGFEAASNIDDEMLAELPSERNIHKCTLIRRTEGKNMKIE